MKKSIQLVALLLTVVMGSCTGGKDKAATEHVVEKPKVKVADVKARPVDQIQEYTATVEAEAKNNIAPSSPVRIDQIFVEVGDRVSKGQKLVQMDAANLTQTKLQLDNQKIEFNRIDELYKVCLLYTSIETRHSAGQRFAWSLLRIFRFGRNERGTAKGSRNSRSSLYYSRSR